MNATKRDETRGPEGFSLSPIPDPLLNLRQIADILGIGKRTLERRIAAGAFPPADLRSGRRISRWRPSTLQAWIDSRGGGSIIPFARRQAETQGKSRRQTRGAA